jgi:hypothetical protein
VPKIPEGPPPKPFSFTDTTSFSPEPVVEFLQTVEGIKYFSFIDFMILILEIYLSNFFQKIINQVQHHQIHS